MNGGSDQRAKHTAPRFPGVWVRVCFYPCTPSLDSGLDQQAHSQVFFFLRARVRACLCVRVRVRVCVYVGVVCVCCLHLHHLFGQKRAQLGLFVVRLERERLVETWCRHSFVQFNSIHESMLRHGKTCFGGGLGRTIRERKV